MGLGSIFQQQEIFCSELSLTSINPHSNWHLHKQQCVLSVYVALLLKRTPSPLPPHLLCRQWPHPAVAVSSGATDRQVLPVLHQLDRRRLGVQAF